MAWVPFLLAIPLAIAIGANGDEWGAGATLAVLVAAGAALVGAMAVTGLARFRMERERHVYLSGSARRAFLEGAAAFERLMEEEERKLEELSNEQEATGAALEASGQQALPVHEDPAIAAFVDNLNRVALRHNKALLMLMREQHVDVIASLEQALETVKTGPDEPGPMTGEADVADTEEREETLA